MSTLAKVWFAPRFDSVHEEMGRRPAEYEQHMRDRPACEKSLETLFVLAGPAME